MNALAQAPFGLGCGFGQSLTDRTVHPIGRCAAAVSGCGIVARPTVLESFYPIERNIGNVGPKNVTSCRRARIKPSHRFKAVPRCIADDQQHPRRRVLLE
jgi:hypothetical protein